MYQTTHILNPNKYSLKSVNADLLHEMSPVASRQSPVASRHSVQKDKSSVWCHESYRGEDMAKVKILLLILLGCGNWLNEE
jgi:hypothetical protein